MIASTNRHGVAQRQSSGRFMYQVLTEHKFALNFSKLRQRRQRLLALFRRALIHGGNRTATAGLYNIKLHVPDADTLPGVLGKWLTAIHHDIWTKPVHWQRLRQPGIEVGQRSG